MRTLFLAVAFLLCFGTTCSAQTFQNHFTTYTTWAIDSTNTIIYQTATIDGYTQVSGMPPGVVHTPKIYNKIAAAGGWFTGTSVCPSCHVYQTNTQEWSSSPGAIQTGFIQMDVQCSVAGLFFAFTVSDYVEIATTKSVRTGNSTNDGVGGFITPVGQFCDAAHYPPDFDPIFADT